jgi:3-hydroxyethyl bacteriochlorophyllide a dehydrogenase
MDTVAVVLEEPEKLTLRRLALDAAGAGDAVVDIVWSGISTGTERLLWTGRMPPFPGLGYPLVPGYESVGRIVDASDGAAAGDLVFVPGAKCFGPVRGLFGGAASRVIVPSARLLPIPEQLGERGVLLALAATAHHALVGGAAPDLIVGHGALGRLAARLCVALGHPAPVVWEREAGRREGAQGYDVIDPDADDSRRLYRTILDVSGDARLLDTLIGRLSPGGEIVLAGFYAERLGFEFPPAFMREARLRVAAQWQQADLVAVRDMAASFRLSLDGLISHRAPAESAQAAYRTAFNDTQCLKMILDWREAA